MLGVNYCLLDFHTFIWNVLEVFLDPTIRKTFNEQKAYAHVAFLSAMSKLLLRISPVSSHFETNACIL